MRDTVGGMPDEPSGTSRTASATHATDRSAPRWLTEDEQHSLTTLAAMMNRLQAALDAQLRRDAAITSFEYVVMATLSESPDYELRMSELAERASGSLSRLSQAVARLEKQGWVRRAPDPADGRYTLARLTGDGRDKVVASAPGHVEEVRRLILDPLTTRQTQQLTAAAQRILRAIDEPS